VLRRKRYCFIIIAFCFEAFNATYYGIIYLCHIYVILIYYRTPQYIFIKRFWLFF
jgi:hypothetical protein